MRLVNGLVLLGLLAVCLVCLAACEKRTPAGGGPAELMSVVPPQHEQSRIALYNTGVAPLKTEQCGQCHFPVYDAIREDGGKHQLDCVKCHETYHVYSPRKQNYLEIMPKCDTCHVGTDGGAFHGADESLKDCLNCHADAHRPLLMDMDKLSPDCGTCHKSVAGELKMNPSAHSSDVGCDDCHADNHGKIPECADCHESHSPGVEMASADCMSCHPVHKPTVVSYADETSSAICAGCHADVQHDLNKVVTKHTNVPCSGCHLDHKSIEPCSKCHGEPHSKTMMHDTAKCGDCHGTAHELAAG
ncbi:MAG: cytochrome C [Proteobacteria bacterium]|nr:cytochrome C [Pseudomonadota bacterium]